MLTEPEYELLTAFVDGELSARQRKQILRLLRRSPEARHFLRKLQTDSQLLQSLPRYKSDPDFALRVTRAIADAPKPVAPTAEIYPPVAAPAPASLPVWLNFALAAALLFAVTLGSYLFFASQRPNEPGPIVQQQPPTKQPAPAVEPPGVKFAFRDLQQDDGRKKLREELKKDTAFHLTVASRDNGQAVKQLQEAFKKIAIELLVDPHAQMKINNKEKTSLVVYLENVPPEEANAILQHLAVANAGGKAENLQHLILGQLEDNHRQQLAKLLGIEADKLRAPQKLEPKGEDPMAALAKPLMEGPKKKPPMQPRTPPPARLAVVLALGAEGEAQTSASTEVRRFVAARTAPQPGTLQLVFVLHEVLV